MTVPNEGADPAHQVNPVEPAAEPTWWDEFSQSVDEPFRDLVKEPFNKWEEAQRAKVTEQVSKYEPYSELLASPDATPENVKRALAIAHALDDDEEGFLKQLAEHVGYDLQDGSTEPQQTQQQSAPNAAPEPNNPFAGFNDEDLSPFEKHMRDQFLAMQRQSADQMQVLSQMGSYLQSQNQMTEAQKDEQKVLNWLDKEKQGHEAYWDQNVALTFLSGGGELPEAIELMKARHHMANPNNPVVPNNVQPQQQTPPAEPAPEVIGGGTLPSNQRPISELNDDQTEDLVVGMIQAAQRAAQ